MLVTNSASMHNSLSLGLGMSCHAASGTAPAGHVLGHRLAANKHAWCNSLRRRRALSNPPWATARKSDSSAGPPQTPNLVRAQLTLNLAGQPPPPAKKIEHLKSLDTNFQPSKGPLMAGSCAAQPRSQPVLAGHGVGPVRFTKVGRPQNRHLREDSLPRSGLRPFWTVA